MMQRPKEYLLLDEEIEAQALEEWEKIRKYFGDPLYELCTTAIMTDWKTVIGYINDTLVVQFYPIYPNRDKPFVNLGSRISGPDSYKMFFYPEANYHVRVKEVPVDWLTFKEQDIFSSYSNGVNEVFKLLQERIIKWGEKH